MCPAVAAPRHRLGGGRAVLPPHRQRLPAGPGGFAVAPRCGSAASPRDDTERVLASLPPLSAVLGCSTLWPVSKPAVSLLASEHSVRLRDVVPGRGVCSAPWRRLPAAAHGQLRCSSRRPSAAAGGLSGASTCAALSRTPSSRGIFAGLRVRCAPSSLRRSGSSSRRRLAHGEPPPPAALPPCARFPGRR